MDKDKLKDSLEQIRRFCNDNDIAIFTGSMDHNVSTEVSWDKSQDNDLVEYLTTIKKTETKIIVIDVGVNKISEDDDEIKTYRQLLDDEEQRKQFEATLRTIKQKKECVFQFTLSFFHNNVCYSYYDSSDWIEDYDMIIELAYTTFEDEDFAGTAINDWDANRIDDDKIEELARKLVSNEDFENAKNRFQKMEIANIFLKLELVGVYNNHQNIYSVTHRARTILETEIKPKREAEIKKQILDFKEKNFNKVQIASKLNISKGMVDKFFYSDL